MVVGSGGAEGARVRVKQQERDRVADMLEKRARDAESGSGKDYFLAQVLKGVAEELRVVELEQQARAAQERALTQRLRELTSLSGELGLERVDDA